MIYEYSSRNRRRRMNATTTATTNKATQRRSLTRAVSIQVRWCISFILSHAILLVVCCIAVSQTSWRILTEPSRLKRPEEERILDERTTSDDIYYIERWGYKAQVHEVTTDDGYILRLYRLVKTHDTITAAATTAEKPSSSSSKRLRPVLLGHGLFQSSGDFLLNEQHSLAFVLAEKGYDVWLGNTRATASFDHVSLDHNDLQYWDWGFKELCVYDWPALVKYVQEQTGYTKIAYIGHSQGNAQAFIGLKLRSNMAEKLSCFIALAPAVFSGTLVSKFPLKQLIGMDRRWYRLIFADGMFIPIMLFAQKAVHPVLFAHMAYSMFAYLFGWWDTHWIRRRKPKYFQCTPRPVSARLIRDWLDGWGQRGACLHLIEQHQHAVAEKDPTTISACAIDPDRQQQQQQLVPLTVFYGTDDYLVDGDRLVQSFEGYEQYGRASPPLFNSARTHAVQRSTGGKTSILFPMLDLVHAERIDGYEHMDTIWAYNNTTTTYPGILNALNAAHWDDVKT